MIKYWIEEQAPFDARVSQFETQEKITAIIASLQEAPEQSWIPEQNVDAASEKTLKKLSEVGVNPMPLAAGSNYLLVTFTGKPNLDDTQIEGLREIEEQLVWLNLSNTNVTDHQLEGLSALGNLRILYLNNTNVTDEGLSKISSLRELRSLSLVGTKITDGSIGTFTALPNLSKLFVFGTSLTPAGIEKLMVECALR